MACVDIAADGYRTTTDPAVKEQWAVAVLTDGGYLDRAGAVAAPPVRFTAARRGAWRYHRPGDGGVVVGVGPRPVTDLDLAVMVAQVSRMVGLPTGHRPAAAPVHDRAMVMLAISAAAVHDPALAEQFHRFCGVLRLTAAAPGGGWPWA